MAHIVITLHAGRVEARRRDRTAGELLRTVLVDLAGEITFVYEIDRFHPGRRVETAPIRQSAALAAAVARATIGVGAEAGDTVEVIDED